MPTARREILRRDVDGARLVDDPFEWIDDATPLPAEGSIIVSLARREADPALARRGHLGLRVAGDTDDEALAALLDGVSLIEVQFPKFTDGRGYSLARLLRERHGYRGELRAVGHVLRDQLFYMARCGFDSFALHEGQSVDDALRAFDDFTVTYQPAADHDLPIWARRRAASGSSRPVS